MGTSHKHGFTYNLDCDLTTKTTTYDIRLMGVKLSEKDTAF